MKYSKNTLAFLLLTLILSCNTHNSSVSKNEIAELNLKRGDVISCGAPDKEFGTAKFETTCSEDVKKDFNVAIELLHSFEYDESEKVFAAIIDKSPECAMAYWGVAMCNFHPLWEPPSVTELEKGAKAVEIAKSISKKSEREAGYINAVGAYYEAWDKTNPRTRAVNFKNAMEQLHNNYPDDKEATIFYALALVASADPTDKTYANQKKAGEILNALYPGEPNHPGIVHYIIHTYDYPGLAKLALPAAREYANVAPSSAHALHMPSHIFTRLGLWDESIQSNLRSIEAAKCYAESAGIKGHWDEEFHGMDYLVYAYLQKGENDSAQAALKYLQTMNDAYPVNFKVAYAFSAIPSRVVLENKNWKDAAELKLYPLNFPWQKFPWQEAILHFTRLIGAVNLENKSEAINELTKLNVLRDTLMQQKDLYKSKLVEVQIKTGEAWIEFKNGNKDKAVNLMELAANMEDSTEKHPVTPSAVLPARELLADMLFQMNNYAQSLQAYEDVLQNCPNRFNSLYGAAIAARKTGNKEKETFYLHQLSAITANVKSDRKELAEVKYFK